MRQTSFELTFSAVTMSLGIVFVLIFSIAVPSGFCESQGEFLISDQSGASSVTLKNFVHHRSVSSELIQLENIPDKSVVSGQAVRFTCGLLKGESVSFSWSRNGTLMSSNDRVKISVDEDNSVLTIRKATVSDAGEYTCVAKNFFAEARQSTTLSVDGECRRILRLLIRV